MKKNDIKFNKFIKWLKNMNNIHLPALLNNHVRMERVYKRLNID